MTSFTWQRYSISPEDYAKIMGFDEKLEAKASDSSKKPKYEKAYEAAEKIRQFEIELSWKRATFFWAFIVAIYTAYYHVLTKIYVYKCGDVEKFKHGEFPLLILSALGLFFCFSWLLSSKGSKHWQENWENHLDLLEDNITGPLYKTYEAGKNYSVSKITIAAGWAVTLCSYGLLLYEFANMVKRKVAESGCVTLGLVLAFAIIIAVFLFGYSVLVTGNISTKGKIDFQTKIYGD